MSGAINYIMNRICGQGAFDIPTQILEVIFKDDWLDRNMPMSLQDRVFTRVIRPRVLRDIDMYYGEQILIDLNKSEFMNVGDYARIYRFSPDHTNNREIISADCVRFMPFGAYSNYQSSVGTSMIPGQQNDLMTYGSQMMSSVSSLPMVSSTRVEIVGFNTIRITDNQRFASSYSLRCFVTNDNRLANIPPQAWEDLLQLCLLAVKAYCYNEYVIVMGQSHLVRGQELGIFKEIIEEWKEAAKEYYTFKKENWAVQGIFMNDDQHHGLLQMMVTLGM